MFNIDDMHWTVEMTSNRIIDNNGLIFCSHYVDRFISAIFKSIIHKFGKIHIFCDAKCLLAIGILWLASLHIHRSIKLYRLVKGKVYDIFHGSMNSHLCKSTFFCSVVQTKENNQIWQNENNENLFGFYCTMHTYCWSFPVTFRTSRLHCCEKSKAKYHVVSNNLDFSHTNFINRLISIFRWENFAVELPYQNASCSHVKYECMKRNYTMCEILMGALHLSA